MTRDEIIDKILKEYFETNRLSVTILKQYPEIREEALEKIYVNYYEKNGQTKEG